MTDPVEADETCVGGKEKNKNASKKLKAVRGPVGKTPIVGANDHATGQVSAEVTDRADAKTLQGFAEARTARKAKVYTDDAKALIGRTKACRIAPESVFWTMWAITKLKRFGHCLNVAMLEHSTT